jgi:pimeloyl-ACP methyl ester carboxylesterase
MGCRPEHRAVTLGHATLLAALVQAGCGERTGAPSGAARDAGDEGTPSQRPFPIVLPWEPCPFYTGGAGNDAECAIVEVPADWDDLDDPTIELFVKRLGDLEGTGTRVWTLMGGPGGAAAGYESFAAEILAADPTLTFYLLDHRGTGRSSRLGCPDAESPSSAGGRAIEEGEWPGCIESLRAQWGDTLDDFTTTNAARDLGTLIDAVSPDKRRNHVHGGSYGTFWAQRYLQRYAHQPGSVSMIGVVHPDFSFTRYDFQYDAVGKELLDRCAQDAFCAGKVGSDPEATFAAVLDGLEAGACPGAAAAGLDRARIVRFNGATLLFGFHERAVIPALIHRLGRCSAADVAALEHFAGVPDPVEALRNDPLYSAALGTHVALSELWERPSPSLAEIEALSASTFSSVGSTARLKTLEDVWPIYVEDAYAGAFAETDVPMLMLNGTLDPASTIAEARQVGQHFDGENQTFVEIPMGAHSWPSPTTLGYDCAINAFFAFLEDPEALVLDCAGLAVDFAGTPSLAETYFGTTDL